MKLKGWVALAILGWSATANSTEPTTTGQATLVEQVKALNWIHGPAIVPVGDEATIKLPAGTMYLDATQSKRFLELNGNPPSDNSYTIAPESLSWFAIYGFDPAGYVSDSEKIDPPKLLDSLLQNQRTGNDERKRLGISGLYVDGWAVQPHYDRSSHNLEWATQMHNDQGAKLVNYTSRILGRDGVMSAILVSDPASLPTDLPSFRAAVSGFEYQPAKRYEEHKDGDKLAAYGLGALITGGAAAVAVKTGLFAGLFALLAKFSLAFSKAIVVGVLAFFAWAASLVKKLFNRRTDVE